MQVKYFYPLTLDQIVNLTGSRLYIIINSYKMTDDLGQFLHQLGMLVKFISDKSGVEFSVVEEYLIDLCKSKGINFNA